MLYAGNYNSTFPKSLKSLNVVKIRNASFNLVATEADLFMLVLFLVELSDLIYLEDAFLFQVPGSAEKSDLSTILEKIPIHCQQLQVLVKSPTVGKSATFSKVILLFLLNI